MKQPLDVRQALRDAIGRSHLIDPFDPQSTRREQVKNHLTQVLAGLDDHDVQQKSAEMHRAALTNPAVRQELNELQIETINNYGLATMNFAQFFRQQALGPSDRPAIINRTMQEISYGYLGSEGQPRRTKIQKDQTEVLLDLRYINSDEVNYIITDIYNGDVTEAAKATIDLAYDLANKKDKLAFDLLTAAVGSGGAYGSITYTGAAVSRVLMTNSRVKTANLPDTNSITVPSSSGAKFRWAVLSEIGRYAARWAGCFKDGGLAPTGRVIMPAKDIWDLADGINPTGSTSNAKADQIMDNGVTTRITYMGVNWELIPDNTIDSGACYAQFNRPVGTIYSKPSLDQEFVETDNKKNIESRWGKSVWGIYLPAQQRIHTAKFIYTT